MPRQRKPEINPGLVSEALGSPSTNDLVKSLVQKSLSQNPKGRSKTLTPTEEVVARGDVTKRPMLPEEFRDYNPSTPDSSSSSDYLKKAQTPSKARELIQSMAQGIIRPFRNRDEELGNDDKVKLWFQSHEIKSKLKNGTAHPESCTCNPKGGCSSRQSKEGTSRLPVGISPEEENDWINAQAEVKKTTPDIMKSWYQEQKSPTAIDIAPNIGPEEHHHLLTQFDHDPTEECHAHGRNPIGHVVTVWNHDGSIPNFPKGFNVGLVVGVAPRSVGEGKKSLSPEIIAAHHSICGEGTTHKEGCPVGFHDKNCRGGKHAEGCEIPQNTMTDASHEGETLYKVIPWVETPPDEIQKRHRSKIDFNSLDSPEPELKSTGLKGLPGGTVVPASRCIHVPTHAINNFFFNRDTEGKKKVTSMDPATKEVTSKIFPKLAEENILGSRPVLLKQPKFFENPLGYRKYQENRSLPGFAYVMDQLESGKTNLEGVPEFVRGQRPERPKSQGESVMDDIINKTKTEGTTASSRSAYTHVNEFYEPTPSCRFCEDASNVNERGPIVQTGTATDGRPLFAHEDCDNPFEFAEKFKFNFEGPNPVDADFISLGSYNWGMGSQPGAKRVNRELGIVTPSKPSRLVDPGFAAPGNTKSIGSMGLPEHKAAEADGDGEVDPATVTQVNNLNSNGTAQPPK